MSPEITIDGKPVPPELADYIVEVLQEEQAENRRRVLKYGGKRVLRRIHSRYQLGAALESFIPAPAWEPKL